jgi:hypothetical protein
MYNQVNTSLEITSRKLPVLQLEDVVMMQCPFLNSALPAKCGAREDVELNEMQIRRF